MFAFIAQCNKLHVEYVEYLLLYLHNPQQIFMNELNCISQVFTVNQSSLQIQRAHIKL